MDERRKGETYISFVTVNKMEPSARSRRLWQSLASGDENDRTHSTIDSSNDIFLGGLGERNEQIT